jgi:DNA-directed RNA polymerase III subunit RPC11
MLTFCPTCGNLLAIEKKKKKKNRGDEEEEENDFGGDDDEENDALQLLCKTCPYSYSIRDKHWSKTDVPITNKKRVDDVLGGDEAWKNVDTTRSRCPKCSHDVAYFLMVQTRSADEPMTQFFRCVECANQWKEN